MASCMIHEVLTRALPHTDSQVIPHPFLWQQASPTLTSALTFPCTGGGGATFQIKGIENYWTNISKGTTRVASAWFLLETYTKISFLCTHFKLLQPEGMWKRVMTTLCHLLDQHPLLQGSTTVWSFWIQEYWLEESSKPPCKKTGKLCRRPQWDFSTGKYMHSIHIILHHYLLFLSGHFCLSRARSSSC